MLMADFERSNVLSSSPFSSQLFENVTLVRFYSSNDGQYLFALSFPVTLPIIHLSTPIKRDKFIALSAFMSDNFVRIPRDNRKELFLSLCTKHMQLCNYCNSPQFAMSSKFTSRRMFTFCAKLKVTWPRRHTNHSS